MATLRRILSKRPYIVYFVISLLGFAFQVHKISVEYFKYETVTQLKLEFPDRVTPPDVFFCFKHMNFFIDGLNNTNHELFNTSQEAFDQTPSVFKMIKKCRIRSHTEFKSSFELNGTDCIENAVKVSKLVKQRFVCYSYSVTFADWFDLQFFINGNESPFFYSVNSGQKLERHNHYFIFLTPIGYGFYGKSNNFIEHYRQITNKTSGEGMTNFVTIGYKLFESKRLSAPYDTNCFDYRSIEIESQAQCFDQCMSEKSERSLQMIPSEIAQYQPSKLLTMTYPQYEQLPIRNTVSNIRDTCRTICSKPDCHHKHYVPLIVQSNKDTEMAFEVYPSIEPHVVTIFIEKFALFDYVTLVVSCISFWFGWSPYYFLTRTNLVQKVLRTSHLVRRQTITAGTR